MIIYDEIKDSKINQNTKINKRVLIDWIIRCLQVIGVFVYVVVLFIQFKDLIEFITKSQQINYNNSQHLFDLMKELKFFTIIVWVFSTVGMLTYKLDIHKNFKKDIRYKILLVIKILVLVLFIVATILIIVLGNNWCEHLKQDNKDYIVPSNNSLGLFISTISISILAYLIIIIACFSYIKQFKIKDQEYCYISNEMNLY